jgi:hypothetical protein
MWQYKIHVEIEKTSFQPVLLLHGDELPRQHAAQDLCVRFVLKQRERPNHAQVFTRVVNRHKAPSPLAWRIDKRRRLCSSGRSTKSILLKRNPTWLRRPPPLRHLPVGEARHLTRRKQAQAIRVEGCQSWIVSHYHEF